jgi:alkylation response protein AidB-like acyl-CoA dehydrogenase
MEILTYTEDQLAFRKRLAEFCKTRIAPFVDTWEKAHIVPKAVWREFGQAGFLCPTVAKAYGGLGGDFRYSLIVAEELSRTATTGLAAALHSDVIVPYIESFGLPEIKQKYLPGCVSGDIVTAIAMTEPEAGSDLASMRTTAEEDGNDVVINGSKTFISNGINCDLVIVAAKDPAVANKHQAVSLYLIEDGTPGFKRGRQLEKMGWHSQDTAELFFSNCRIPKRNLLGEKGMGFFMLMEKLQQERLTCAVGAVVAAERVLEWTMAYCRTTRVSGRPMTKSQAVQFALVEMATEVKLGRIFMEKLVADHIEQQNIIVETAMAKYWTTDLASRIADRSMDLIGNAATLDNFPVTRAWRDLRVMRIFAGTNEIMKSIAAKFMGM